MSYQMYPVDNGETYFPDAALYASMDFGSNGDPNGDPTYSAGDDQGEEVWGYNVWDSDMSDGFDTGNVPVQFTAATSGYEALDVGSGGITYNGDSFGSISSVDIQAGVLIPATASWSNITVDFCNGDMPVDVEQIATGPAVDTTSSGGQAEQILVVSPPSGDTFNNVIVTGTMRMTAPAGTNPGPDDMYCNIFVNH